MSLFKKIINNKIIHTPDTTRPCMVRGQRAMFHRWTDSARPVVPRGMEEDDEAPRYQTHHVHAMVEYEDGSIDRVWPYEVVFVDGGRFNQWDQLIAEAVAAHE